ncbi:hypothetical protein [Novosphingobium huizhouense]|uniref:hypothetical protein n=1 Tax=Novosphingobium huizhouense TaxID=2866625 RepID=UPI001CD88F63|nr:hypothetical protein [Novosphingobium huizhouense]
MSTAGDWAHRPLRRISLHVLRFTSIVVGAGLILRAGASERAMSAVDEDRSAGSFPGEPRTPGLARGASADSRFARADFARPAFGLAPPLGDGSVDRLAAQGAAPGAVPSSVPAAAPTLAAMIAADRTLPIAAPSALRSRAAGFVPGKLASLDAVAPAPSARVADRLAAPAVTPAAAPAAASAGLRKGAGAAVVAPAIAPVAAAIMTSGTASGAASGAGPSAARAAAMSASPVASPVLAAAGPARGAGAALGQGVAAPAPGQVDSETVDTSQLVPLARSAPAAGRGAPLEIRVQPLAAPSPAAPSPAAPSAAATAPAPVPAASPVAASAQALALPVAQVPQGGLRQRSASPYGAVSPAPGTRTDFEAILNSPASAWDYAEGVPDELRHPAGVAPVRAPAPAPAASAPAGRAYPAPQF